ncbi:MAG: hypothetical protein K0Q72_5213 [Armatimonadetes bacterium]|nr:hypothetical protein [Armatimonadota bacterium]
MTPHIRDPSQGPDDKVRQPPYLLTGRGCDDLHGSGGLGMAHDPQRGASNADVRPEDLSTSGTAGSDGPADPGTAQLDGSTAPGVAYPEGLAVPSSARLDDLPLVGARRANGSRLRSAWVRDHSQWREAASKPRRGWYAYRVVGAATLPAWAVEVALTIERPVDPHPEGLASETEEAARPRPASEEPDGSSRAATRSPSSRSGGYGGQGGPGRQPGPPDPLRGRAQAQAIVLLRAPGRANWLAGIAEVAAEVEAAAGVRRVDDAEPGMESARSRLLMGPPLPGLEPILPDVAQAQLGAAGARGLPAPLRRWRPASGAAHLSWQASVGSVLTCDGPCGVSAQAVVALRGAGHAGAIAPPPGGALVLRAWRAGRTWGAAGGLVLGASQALGLGREAGRVAASARAAGWDAAVLQGLPALRLARAGDHRQVAPEATAHMASGAQVAALFETFLAAGGRGRPAQSAAFSRSLTVTP